MNIREFLRPFVYSDLIQLADQFAYGHREILLVSNKLDPTSLILASIPHGWGPDTFGYPYPKIRNRFLKEYPILAWSSRTAADWTKRGYRLPIAVGSPWAHFVNSVHKNYKVGIKTKEEVINSILFLPTHSVPGGSVKHKFELESLLNQVQPAKVTVCLFWLDFINPKVRNFYSGYGCEITCVGFKGSTGFDNPWSPIGGRELFLPNLYRLFLNHNIVVVDTISTPFWYAASLGKTVYIRGYGDEYTWWGSGKQSELSIDNRNMLALADKNLANLPLDTLIPSEGLLRDTAKIELGFDMVENFLPVVSNYKLLKPGMLESEISSPLEEFYRDYDTQVLE